MTFLFCLFFSPAGGVTRWGGCQKAGVRDGAGWKRRGYETADLGNRVIAWQKPSKRRQQRPPQFWTLYNHAIVKGWQAVVFGTVFMFVANVVAIQVWQLLSRFVIAAAMSQASAPPTSTGTAPFFVYLHVRLVCFSHRLVIGSSLCYSLADTPLSFHSVNLGGHRYGYDTGPADRLHSPLRRQGWEGWPHRRVSLFVIPHRPNNLEFKPIFAVSCSSMDSEVTQNKLGRRPPESKIEHQMY